MTLRPLSGPNAQAFALLTRAAAILRNRGVRDPEATLWRVADQHLPHPRPQPMPFTVKAEPQRTVDLTQTQIDVLNHICDGLSRAEVAQLLGVGVRTVDAHMQRVEQAMGVTTAVQAVALYLGGQVGVKRRRHGKQAA